MGPASQSSLAILATPIVKPSVRRCPVLEYMTDYTRMTFCSHSQLILDKQAQDKFLPSKGWRLNNSIKMHFMCDQRNSAPFETRIA